MSEPVQIPAGAPVTISVDLDAVLRGGLPTGSYDYEADEPVIGGPLFERITELAADKIARVLRDDVRKAVAADVTARVSEVVEATLAEGVQPTDTWGQPTGKATTVAGLVREEATRFLTKQSGDFSRRETALQKLVREAVDRKLATELGQAIAEAKAEVTAKIKEQAAEIMAKTIAGMRA